MHQPAADSILETNSFKRKLRQNANEVRIVFGRNAAQPVAVTILGTTYYERKLRQNANEVRFRLVAMWRKQMLERSFSL